MPHAHGHVALIATGGTISAGPDGPLGAQSLIRLAASGRQGIPTDVPVRGEDLACIPSSCVTIESIEHLATAIRHALDHPGCLGVVVTHGTDTMEEVAFACELLLGPVDRPVVFTGAMIPPKAKRTDAHTNLSDAIRAAQSEAVSGCVVVMDSRVHAAIEVRKLATAGTDAFGSPGRGPIGWIGPGGIDIVRAHTSVRLHATALEPRVELVRLVAGGGDRLMRAATEFSKGLVVELFGAGNAGSDVERALRDAAESGTVVLVCPRVGLGGMTPGTGVLDSGAIPAAVRDGNEPGLWLDGLKSRVLLMAALGAGLGAAGVRALLGAGQHRSD